jgi:plastocyanin
VLADYNLDDHANGYQAFFPRFISAHPGDTIVFRQAWTGDPHTVTLGRMVDAAAKPLLPYLKGTKPLRDQPPQDVIDAFSQLPSFFDPDINQEVAQTCYVASGELPKSTRPCPKAEQREPAVFHGTETFFNSGFIHFAGVGGNRYSLKLANDIKPGEYAFNCVVHGPQMTGTITFAPKSEDIGGQATINAAAHRELDRFAKHMRQLHDATAAARKPAGVDIVAGAAPQAASLDSYDDREFFPSRFETHVGEKVTWLITTEPAHTVSFDVPRYRPVIIVEKNGTVRGNPVTTDPKNGPGYPSDAAPPAPSDTYDPPPPVTVDVGNYDGTKFLSSGASFEGPMRYSVTFTHRGTYPYACLLHPRMVGEIVVR